MHILDLYFRDVIMSVHNIKYEQPIGCVAQLAAQLYNHFHDDL